MESKVLNSKRFLDAYASIEKSLNEINGSRRYIPFSQLLNYTAKQNKLVEEHYSDLKEYNELRNAIVHNRDDKMEIIAEPSISTVLNIEHIAEVLQSGKYAINYANKPVMTVSKDQTILETFSLMEKTRLSKIPVYEKEQFLTLITMEEIARWALYNSGKNEKISVILDKSDTERVVFLDAKSSIQDVITLFEASLQKHEKTPFIIFTETGKKEEKPLGIISSYDLIGVLSLMI